MNSLFRAGNVIRANLVQISVVLYLLYDRG